MWTDFWKNLQVRSWVSLSNSSCHILIGQEQELFSVACKKYLPGVVSSNVEQSEAYERKDRNGGVVLEQHANSVANPDLPQLGSNGSDGSENKAAAGSISSFARLLGFTLEKQASNGDLGCSAPLHREEGRARKKGSGHPNHSRNPVENTKGSTHRKTAGKMGDKNENKKGLSGKKLAVVGVDRDVAWYKQQLVRLYAEFRPEKVDQVDFILGELKFE
jgi:hypothetical protein